MHLKNLIFSILVAVIFPLTLLAVTNPGDEDYFEYKQGTYVYIFSESDKVHLPKIIEANEWYQSEYENSFSWVLDESPRLLLASPKNQVANAFATVFPTTKTVFFPGGQGFLDTFAEASWPETLIIHESSHLYQTNSKDKIPAAFQKVLGNNLYVPILFPFWVFTFPNVLLPTALLEGNAVFNESRFGLGGRLYSGEIRAVLYSLFSKGLADEGYFLNSHLEFPYGREKYWLGGLFFAFLAENFTVDQVNKLYIEHGQRWLNPLLINKSFNNLFGLSFSTLYKQFLIRQTAKAKAFHPVPLESMAQSTSPILFTREGNEVRFITDDGKRNKKLYLLETSSSLTEEKMDLPADRVFKINGKYYASGTTTKIRNGVETIQGLLEPGYGLLDEHSDQIVTDVYKNKVAGFPTNKGHNWNPTVYINGKPFGTCNSAAQFDDEGNLFCFQQSGSTRTLVKNNKALFSYKGFYGKVADIQQGHVYFIAASPLGSTLYVWNQKNIQKIFNYDNIVDAKALSGNRFALVAVNELGYQMGVLDAETTSTQIQNPYEIHYAFEGHESYKKLKSYQVKAPPPLQKEKIKPYSYVKGIQYNNTLPYWGLVSKKVNDVEETEVVGGLQMNFSDPLERNQISLRLEKESYDRVAGGVAYLNQARRLSYQIAYLYQEDSLVNINNELISTHPEELTYLLLDYPLMLFGRWGLSTELGLYNEREFTSNTGETKEFYWDLNLNLSYSRSHALGFLPAHSFSTRLSATEYYNTQAYKADVNHSYDLGYENYINTGLTYAYSKENKIELTDDFETSRDPVEIPAGSLANDIATSEILVGKIGFTSAFNLSYYFNFIPIGLRRFAPFVEAKYFEYKNPLAADEKTNMTEYSYGLTAEFLILHKIPVRFSYAQYENDSDNNNNFKKFLLNYTEKF